MKLSLTKGEHYGDIERYCKRSGRQRYDGFPCHEQQQPGGVGTDSQEGSKNCREAGICAEFLSQSIGISFFSIDSGALDGGGTGEEPAE